MDIQRGWIRSFSLTRWSENKIAFYHERLIRINEKASEITSEAFFHRSSPGAYTDKHSISCHLASVVTDCKNLFSGTGQALMKDGDYDHKNKPMNILFLQAAFDRQF